MVNLVGNINGIPLYVDEYLEDNKLLKGRKGNSSNQFIVVNSRTAEKLLKGILIEKRKKKLNILNNVK